MAAADPTGGGAASLSSEVVHFLEFNMLPVVITLLFIGAGLFFLWRIVTRVFSDF